MKFEPTKKQPVWLPTACVEALLLVEWVCHVQVSIIADASADHLRYVIECDLRTYCHGPPVAPRWSLSDVWMRLRHDCQGPLVSGTIGPDTFLSISMNSGQC